MAGEGFSGKDGTVKYGSTPADMFEVTKWTLNQKAAVHKYNSNQTSGHKKAVVGVHDTSGTIEIKLNASNGVEVLRGALVELQLHVDDSGNNYFQIDEAAIASNDVECDVDEGGIVSATYAFEASDCTGNGILA